MTRRHFLAALLLSLGHLSLSSSAEQPKTVRLFTVGNSFSGNATQYLGELAKANGDTLILGTANVGGASLELHWTKAQAFEKDPSDKVGRYTSGKSLAEALAAVPWDFVTIQQASIKSHDVATYRPYARLLADYIHQHAPAATLMLHQTWEYRIDDPRFTKPSKKAGEPATQDAMYQGLKSAYSTIAKELNVGLLPVGDAFHLADRDPNWGFRTPHTAFNAKTAQPGEVPDQTHSLHVGWTWKKQPGGKTSLIMDGHHANTAGQYLGACVWYEVLFGRSVESNSFVPAGLEPKYAQFLRKTAHEAVADRGNSK